MVRANKRVCYYYDSECLLLLRIFNLVGCREGRRGGRRATRDSFQMLKPTLPILQMTTAKFTTVPTTP